MHAYFFPVINTTKTITKCDMLYRMEITHIYPLGRGCGAGTDILIFENSELT